MISPTQKQLIEALGQLCELSPDVRFGQLLAHLGFLTEDRTDRTLWDVDDQELLAVLEHHRAELSGRDASVAKVS